MLVCYRECAAQVDTAKCPDRVDTKLSHVVRASVMHDTRSARRLGPCQRGQRAFSTIRTRHGHRIQIRAAANVV